MMDPNIDPLLKFMAFKELATLQDEAVRSREPRPRKNMFKKHLIVTIRKLGWLLVDVGHRLEQV